MRLIDAHALYLTVDELEALDIWVSTASANKFKRAIKACPTVDAEPVIRCCDCRHSWESLVPESVNCEEMQRTVYAQGYCYKGERKQESDTDRMNDLISRKTVIKFVSEIVWQEGETWQDVQDRIVDGVSRLTSEDRQIGKWVEDGAITKCDKCGEHKQFPHWKFCPNCGAKMNGDIDEYE